MEKDVKRQPWKTVALFRVDGSPKAQPRPRAFARKLGNGQTVVRAYEAGTAENWKSRIADGSRPFLPVSPLEGPIRVDLDLLLPRPKRLFRKKDPAGELPHDKKPDRDNCEKAVLDAMTELGWWRDDAQVCAGEVRKLYHAKDGRPGARIRVWVWCEEAA